MKNKKHNRFSVLLTTALVLGLGMMAYYYYTNMVKTKRVNNQAYHLLNRKANDVRELEQAFVRVADTKKKQWNFAKLHYNGMDETDSYFRNNLKLFGIDNRNFALNSEYASSDSIAYTSDTMQFISRTDEVTLDGVTYKLAKNEFLKSLNFGQQFFDDYALINRESKIYLFTSSKLSNLDLLPVSPEWMQTKSDSTGITRNLVNLHENQMEVTISGNSYQAFMVPVNENASQGFKYIIGFIKTSTYKNMSRGLDYRLSLTIFYTIFFILLSIPLIRLLVVSPGEPFGLKNTIVLYFNICVLLFLLSFGLLHQSTRVYTNRQLLKYNSTEKVQYQGDLKQVSDALKNEFNTELDSFVIQVEHIVRHQIKTFAESSYSLSEQETWKYRNAVLDSTSYVSRLNYPFYPHLFMEIMADSLANVKLINSTSEGVQAQGVYIDYRDYYKHPGKYKLRNTAGFGFESIFDMTTGIPEAVVSMPRDTNGNISAITSHMYSISNTILPEGYSFCIIDKKGKVWFHNNKFNNSRENYLEEIDKQELIYESLISRSEKSLILNYKLTPQYAHIQPLRAEMDLFLVTMCSKKMYDKKGSYLSTIVFSTSMIFLALFFLICLSAIFVFKIFRKEALNAQRKKGYKSLLLSYFPNNGNTDTYINLSLVNLITFTALLILFITIGYSRLALTDIFVYLLLTALSVTYWNLYYQIPTKNFTQIVFWRIVLIAIVPFVLSQMPLLNNMFGHVSWTEQFSYFLFTLVVNGLFVLLYKQLDTTKKGSEKSGLQHHNYWDKILVSTRYWLHRNWTYAFVSRFFTVLLLIVFLPLFAFFLFFYHNEAVMFRNRQMSHILTSHQHRQSLLQKDYLFPGIPEKKIMDTPDVRKDFYNQRLQKGIYVPSRFSFTWDYSAEAEVNTLKKSRNIGYNNQLNDYVQQFGLLRTRYFTLRDQLEYGVSNTARNYTSTNDSLYYFSGYMGRDRMHLIKENFSSGSSNRNFTILSMNRLQSPIKNKIVLFGLPLILLLCAFVFIRFIPELLKYLFPAIKFNNAFVSQYRKMNRLIGKMPKNIYYMTMPSGALITTRFEGEYKHAIVNYNAVDLFRNPVSMDGYQRRNVFICFHFFILPNLQELQQFIKNFKQLQNEQYIESVNVVALFTPQAFIEHLSELQKPDDIYWKNSVEELADILYGLHAFYIPVNKQMITKGEQKNAYLLENQNLIISISNKVDKTAGFTEITHQEYITYSVAYPYYQRIWKCCTAIEKSVLFDIADDNVINLSSKKEIGILMNKGLVLKGAYLHLFDPSFERFVMKQKAEVKAIDLKLREKFQGGWSVIRLPLLIVSAAVLLFLVVTQQNILTDIQSVLISVGTIITLGLRFIDLPFKSNSKPEGKASST